MATYAYGVFQDGMLVASVEAPTMHEGLREIGHYARMYEQDGPIEIHRIDPETNEPVEG